MFDGLPLLCKSTYITKFKSAFSTGIIVVSNRIVVLCISTYLDTSVLSLNTQLHGKSIHTQSILLSTFSFHK